MLHLACHHDFADLLGFQDFDQLPELPNVDPMQRGRESRQVRRGFILDSYNHDFVSLTSRRFKGKQRETTVAGDHSVALRHKDRTYLQNPRLELRINESSSSTSPVCGISSSMRANA